MADRYYTTGQLAAMCHMTKHTILAAIERGELKASTTPGGHNRIHERDAIGFMEKHNIPTTALRKKGKTILIVDDEQVMRELLEDLFKDSDYVIEIATCGYDAGVMAERVKPDLILLDILLPDIDGREICRQIKRNPVTKHTKVLAVTALKSPEEVAEITEAGADGYIGKPFSVEEIKDRVTDLIEA